MKKKKSVTIYRDEIWKIINERVKLECYDFLEVDYFKRDSKITCDNPYSLIIPEEGLTFIVNEPTQNANKAKPRTK